LGQGKIDARSGRPNALALALGHRAETLLRLTEENDGLLVLGRPAPEAEATPFIGTGARALWMTNRPVLLVP